METRQPVTRAQTKFLRAFTRHPGGPPADQWPSPVVLRRWLKRPGFCGAMNSILRAMRYQADFNLTAAAASGANLLLAAVQNGDVAEARRGIESLVHLMRLSHIRQRYAEPLPEPEPRSMDLIAALHLAHPDISVRDALYCSDVLVGKAMPGESMKLWARTGHPQSSMYKPDEEKEREERERLERRRREAERLEAEFREEEGERDGEIESGEIESGEIESGE